MIAEGDSDEDEGEAEVRQRPQQRDRERGRERYERDAIGRAQSRDDRANGARRDERDEDVAEERIALGVLPPAIGAADEARTRRQPPPSRAAAPASRAPRTMATRSRRPPDAVSLHKKIGAVGAIPPPFLLPAGHGRCRHETETLKSRTRRRPILVQSPSAATFVRP